jgi:hypothetical protein
MIFGKTRLELLNTFRAASGIEELSSGLSMNYCGKYSQNASEAFHKKLICQALPARLAKAFAALPQAPLTADEKQVLSAIKSANETPQISSAVLDNILKTHDR